MSFWTVSTCPDNAARDSFVERNLWRGRFSGRLTGLPIAGIAGDQQAALFGQACFQPGVAKNTYGTGCFMLMNTGAQRWNRITNCSRPWPGSLRPTGICTGRQRFRGRSGRLLAPRWAGNHQVVGRCRTIGSSRFPTVAACILVPAFTGLGAPHWDPYARGAILGITRGTTAAHIARAAVESIALQVADLADAMRSDAANTKKKQHTLTELRVDGGQRQRLAASISSRYHAAPRGSAEGDGNDRAWGRIPCGVGDRRLERTRGIAGHWQVDRRFEPQMPGKKRPQFAPAGTMPSHARAAGRNCASVT